jgi:subtilase family serine protease
MNPTQQLQLSIALPLRNQAELDALLLRLLDPQSQDYRRFLTAQEFADRFGPAESDYAAVIAFAKTNGLAVTATHQNRTLVGISATVADIENTLHVHLLLYQHPYDVRQFHAPDADPSVDLAVPLLHICGLNDYSRPRPAGCTGTGSGGSFKAYDLRSAYLPDVGSANAVGQNVAIVEFSSDYYPGDITAYESACGLPNVPVQRVQLDGYTGLGGGTNNVGQTGEVSLDIEMAIALTAGLNSVTVYEGLYARPADILNRIATDDTASQISISWYGWVPQGGERQSSRHSGSSPPRANRSSSPQAMPGLSTASTSREWIPRESSGSRTSGAQS